MGRLISHSPTQQFRTVHAERLGRVKISYYTARHYAIIHSYNYEIKFNVYVGNMRNAEI